MAWSRIPICARPGKNFCVPTLSFTSVAGTAEATTLDDHSVDFVTAAQAAHWFDREKARREFIRICRPGGWTVLLWNERRTGSTPFLRAYEQLLLEYGTDYQEVRHERTTEQIETFFAPSRFQFRTFEYQQEFDYPALEGRLLSSSYTPQPGETRLCADAARIAANIRRAPGGWSSSVRVRHPGVLRTVGLSFRNTTGHESRRASDKSVRPTQST